MQMQRVLAASLDDWLHLFHVSGLGAVGFFKLLRAFSSPSQVLEQGFPALQAVIGARLAAAILEADTLVARERVASWLAQSPMHRVLTLADEDYPAAWLNMHDAPPVVFLKGRADLLARPMCAVVGSRNATAQGLRDAESFAQALTEKGLTVISGLAAGIDAAAHRGALGSEASTIAVIGTGIDRIYPAKNHALAHDIAAQGLIVSEFPLGAGALAHHFPRRNRLIAGLALGCLVVEANLASGSLITARLAGELNKEVMAIPGSIHLPQARGCHQLLREGAALIECIDDIVFALNWQNPPLAPVVTAKIHSEDKTDCPVLCALAAGPADIDTLLERAGLTLDSLYAMLLTLELSGQVAALPGGRYERLY